MLTYTIANDHEVPMDYTAFTNHGSLSCKDHDHLASFNRMRPSLRFITDSCCFTCLLPTKVCKGHFQSVNQCLSPPMIPIWLNTMLSYQGFLAEKVPDFFHHIGLARWQDMRQEQIIQRFLGFEWKVLDTEVLYGVLLFLELHKIFAEQMGRA